MWSERSTELAMPPTGPRRSGLPDPRRVCDDAAMRGAVTVFIAAIACSSGTRSDGTHPGPADSAAPGDDSASGDATAGPLACTGDTAAKLRFEQPTGCLNDGSVEFCIPADDPQLRATLAAIAPAITCDGGGGRAGCLRSPGLLLCTYPTRFPEECVAQHGALADAAWSKLCQVAALPQITAIVPTWFE